ncbi:MAG: universal stress protein [Desulfarculaceae bacterium]|nr:universal stress protein [Desulfarculaceae bacterium]MCF8074317.1 universal stress protein [Desulfarculaceae bacterium]MCF8103385.1 universal stress protein [Desulfarculaceae bacterium]MCF8117760.1 universal stress protein [Desulfarculaceae bacterium]
MAQAIPKVLVAVDGSKRSLATARYAARTLRPGAVRLVAFCVLDVMPQSYWDLHNDPAYAHRLKGVKAWALERELATNRFMDKVLAALRKEGHPAEMVSAKVSPRRIGVASDILAEAGAGYHTVIIGRRGVGAVRGILLGSVALKLAGQLTTQPLWVVGKDAKPPRVLITLDGSPNSLRAVDYLAGLCGGQPLEITLLHVLRPLQLDSAQPGASRDDAERVLAKGVRRLREAGFHPSLLNQEVVEGAASRAAAIVEAARQGGYGTIVMGRKGLSDNSQFSLGRVTAKVLGASRGLAVWAIP